jgi:GAF domain-containing protein
VSQTEQAPNGEQPTVQMFARFASELHEAGGVEETVEAVAQFALHAVGCSAASVALIVRGRRPEPVAMTDPGLAELYDAQIAAGAGPLITTIQQEAPVTITDVVTETRWSPAWAHQVAAAGYRSAAHLPLSIGRRKAEAVLSLFGDRPQAFDSDDLAVAHILARHASVAIAAARNEATLAGAADARKLVGQAQGILMERFDLDADRAFEVLKRYSQDHNRKLRDVAEELIRTRVLPGRF